MDTIRAADHSDFEAILALNAAEEQQTSALDLARLQSLASMAVYCKVFTVDDRVAAFLLAMENGSPYANDNYRWFVARFARFLYVDRIVVGAEFAGRKIGTKLYEDLFAFARDRGIGTVTCEYNVIPPNLASRAFHEKFGFEELGTQWVAGGSKKVSLQAAKT